MTLKRALNWCVAAVLLNGYLLIVNAMAGGWWNWALGLINASAIGLAMDAYQKLRKLAREEPDGKL